MKVTIRVELTVDEDEMAIEQIDLPAKIRQLCRDAFGEFGDHRRDAKAYVAKRYSGAWFDSANKVREVEGRVELACLLSAGVSDAIIEVQACCPKCGAVEPRADSTCPVCRDAYCSMMESADAQMGDSTP